MPIPGEAQDSRLGGYRDPKLQTDRHLISLYFKLVAWPLEIKGNPPPM